LAGWFTSDNEFWEEVLEEVHEFFANFSLFLVIIHVAGVVVESKIHNENLVRAMWDGYKKKQWINQWLWCLLFYASK